ncbi:hypothetical protein F5146DRAFT_172250 [Armillaria mellea]|nr:hypothetical protein F5146DRAFT_172250 [Armillaria mellea]
MTSPMAPGQRGGTPYLIAVSQQPGVPSRGQGGGGGGVAEQQGGLSVSVSPLGRAVAAYGSIHTGLLPMEITARIIDPPKLKYGLGSQQVSVQRKDGAWLNLVDKKFTKPTSLGPWIVVIFVPPNQFSPYDAKRTITDLVQGCEAIGMHVPEKQPLFVYKNPHDNVDESIMEALTQTTHEPTQTFLLCILPDDNNEDLYKSVKHCGDIKRGIANQCLRVGKCRNARPQYWSKRCPEDQCQTGRRKCYPRAQDGAHHFRY